MVLFLGLHLHPNIALVSTILVSSNQRHLHPKPGAQAGSPARRASCRASSNSSACHGNSFPTNIGRHVEDMHDTKRHNGRHNGRHWKHCDMSNVSDMSISFAQVSATNVALNLEGHLRPVLQLYQVSHTTKVNGWMFLICGFTWFHSWTPSFVRVTNLGQDSIVSQIGGLWRFVMGCHALWWFVMGCDALWWFVTVSDGLWWVVTACAGLWWF